MSEIRLECEYMEIVVWGKDAHIPHFQGCCKETFLIQKLLKEMYIIDTTIKAGGKMGGSL